ncbi:DUF3999 family protein [Lysobacter claricitrinus]|uniref:DUF3999 family protein n=1 Tax=Lysobacter claricitrinus TaxID=3367728 RepID=UPI0037DAD965
MKRVIAVLLASATTFAFAADADYARQWPVVVPAAPAGAYTVELTPEVYAAVQRADLGDLDVLDAAGRPVPADVLAPAAQASEQRRALPWYRMPAPGTTAGSDWRVIAEVDADGRLRGLRSSAVDTVRPATTLLIDAAALRESPIALDVSWRPGANFDSGYRVEGSTDFDHWYELGRGRLVDLREGAHGLRMRRLAIEAGVEHPRFLRLVPDDTSRALPDITGIDAIWTSSPQRAPVWRTLAPRANADGAFEFQTDGRYPVRWVDVDGAGNDVRTWHLQSRDTPQAHWVDRVPYWIVYRVGAGRSPARVFDMPVRDRYWRLVPQGAGDAPTLKLGYLPERVTFVAGGRPPYALVAGSRRQRRESRPVQVALRDAAGAPALARLGPSAQRAGDAALAPVRDWKTWGLWAVLGLGVLAVGTFALRVLREPQRTAD